MNRCMYETKGDTALGWQLQCVLLLSPPLSCFCISDIPRCICCSPERVYSAHSVLGIDFVTEPIGLPSSSYTHFGISPAHLFNLSSSFDLLAWELTAAVAYGVHKVAEEEKAMTQFLYSFISLMPELATQEYYRFILQEESLCIKGVDHWS